MGQCDYEQYQQANQAKAEWKDISRGKMADKTNMDLSPGLGLGFSSPRGVAQARAAVVLGLRLPGSGAFLGGSDDKESAYHVGDLGSIPGLGRSAGEGNDNLLQYSCL